MDNPDAQRNARQDLRNTDAENNDMEAYRSEINYEVYLLVIAFIIAVLSWLYYRFGHILPPILSFKIPKNDEGPKLPPGLDLDILLVGKTGHGKSAAANSILGVKHFVAMGDTSSVTQHCGIFQNQIDGRKLVVVDAPGVWNTGMTSEKDQQKTSESFNAAYSFSPEGFHAIVLVFKYGGRITDEEVTTIEKMKKMLGEDVLKHYGVLLITNGDNFARDNEGLKSFQTWLKQQMGTMATILKECNGRCILFNNNGDEITLQKQRFELIKIIDGMQNGERCEKLVLSDIKSAWDRFEDKSLRSIQLEFSEIKSLIDAFDLKKNEPKRNDVNKVKEKLQHLQTLTDETETGKEEKLSSEISKLREEVNQLEDATTRGNFSSHYKDKRKYISSLIEEIDNTLREEKNRSVENSDSHVSQVESCCLFI